MWSRRERLPVTIVRPSIVVGERGTGWTASFNVVYGPLRAFASGTYPVIPGRRDAVLDIVTVDHVADAILALAASPAAAGRTFHVVGGEQATTLGELVRLAARRFDRRGPRFVPPRIYRSVLHPLILRRADPSTRGRLVRSEVYFPYFSLDLRFDDHRARSCWSAGHTLDAVPRVFRHADRLRRGRGLGTGTDRARRRGCTEQANPFGAPERTHGRIGHVTGSTRPMLRRSVLTDGRSPRRHQRAAWLCRARTLPGTHPRPTHPPTIGGDDPDFHRSSIGAAVSVCRIATDRGLS